MTPEEIQKKAIQVQEIYSAFLLRLGVLKSERGAMIKQFIQSMEQKKIEDIKRTLNSL